MTEQDQVFAKCARRLIPFMMLLFVLNYLDRVNVGFAALTMNKDLGFSPSVFGFGAGVLFLGYSLFQVPANAVLSRMGARRWMFCIMAIWGLISASSAFVQGPTSFYALRFLLGVAEAGLFPGMIFYLTLWFPQAYRARFTATFCGAIPLSFIIGGPLSGLILEMDGVASLHGWQWLFLMEGLPAFLLAFAVLGLLPDGPGDARWLTGDEKKTIAACLATEDSLEHRGFWLAWRDPRLLVLGVLDFGIVMGLTGYQLWLPQIVQAMGFSNLATGFAVASLVQDNLLALAALTCAAVGLFAIYGPLFSLPSSFLRGPAAAGGIALVNTIATSGGFVGPAIIGMLKEETGGYAAGMAVLALALALSAVIVLALGRAMAARAAMLRAKAGAGA